MTELLRGDSLGERGEMAHLLSQPRLQQPHTMSKGTNLLKRSRDSQEETAELSPTKEQRRAAKKARKSALREAEAGVASAKGKEVSPCACSIIASDAGCRVTLLAIDYLEMTACLHPLASLDRWLARTDLPLSKSYHPRSSRRRIGSVSRN